jgi:integrase
VAKTKLRLISPTNENRTVTPRRRPNAELRTREHLTEREVERLMEAAKHNRHGQRDFTMVLMAYRHGLRASELCDLRWDQLDFNRAVLHVRRVKQGTPATHPLTGLEMRAPFGSCSGNPRHPRSCSSRSEGRHSRRQALPEC